MSFTFAILPFETTLGKNKNKTEEPKKKPSTQELMPVDIKSVDPAIVKASSKPEPRPKQHIPVFLFLGASVHKTDDGFSPSVNFESHVVVHTSDDKYVSVARTVASKAPLAAESESHVIEFPHSAEALITVLHWCDKYGIDGKAESVFPNPVTHTDFTILLTSDWEKNFNHNVLNRHDGLDVFVASINAAESLKINGLLDFLIVALGCAIRGKSDLEIQTVLHSSEPVTEADLAAVKGQYPWLESAIAAKSS